MLQLDFEAYCTSCSSKAEAKIVSVQNEKVAIVKANILDLISVIPVITSQAPSNWDYEVIDIVTSQTTSGTGFLTDLSQSFNDFLGQGSNATNKKVALATTSCKLDLRKQCILLGGNAIISTDIDFSEVGSGNTNMLMVCMAGTAVRVTDTTTINKNDAAKFNEISKLGHEWSALANLSAEINKEFAIK
ncbi:hypothetical protein Dfri01_65880 [Dyadobacter frigoris]|nr:hypothetical protein Dfri01_65880 [Dyadobacter frigoris]